MIERPVQAEQAVYRLRDPRRNTVTGHATSVPLYLLLFAAMYYVMGGISVLNFSEPLTRTDALYFTVTVFATVGFGDIKATTEVARALVTGQMVAGIIVVGRGPGIIVAAIKHGRQQQPTPGSGPRKGGDHSSE